MAIQIPEDFFFFLEFFVPGFVFLFIFNRAQPSKKKSFNHDIVASIIISYLIKVIYLYFTKQTENLTISEDLSLTDNYNLVLIGAISGGILAIISNSKLFDNIHSKLFKKTVTTGVWNEILKDNPPPEIRCMANYLDDCVVIEGVIKFFEDLGDSCDIVLEDFVVYREKDGLFVRYTDKEPLEEDHSENSYKSYKYLCLNSRDISWIEIKDGYISKSEIYKYLNYHFSHYASTLLRR